MRLHRPAAIAAAIVLSVFSFQAASAQTPEPAKAGAAPLNQTAATITGMVFDPSAAAVADAAVLVQPLDPTGTSVSARSGPDGRFDVHVSAGRYRVSVRHPSFAPAERSFILGEGENRSWDVALVLEKMSSNVIVTAAAEPSLAVKTPDLVDVITRKQIDQRQEVWLADMLASQEGAAFTRLGAYGGIGSYFLDGGNSGYTKVLVDGTPVNQPGGALDFSNFTVSNIDKIEVVHGASSALYGSDAMDGVIQIFTHRGSTKTPEIAMEGDGGTFGTGHGDAQISGLLGKFDYSAATDYFSTRGQGPGDSFRDVTASGNFGWKFSDRDSVRLGLRNTSSDAGQPGQTLLPGGATIGESSKLHDFAANLAANFSTGEHWQHQVSVFESRFQDVVNFPPFGAFTSKYNRAGAIAQSSYVFRNSSFTVGYENEVENGPSAGRHNQAGYIEAHYQFSKRLTAIAGGRVEANGFFGTRAVPRAGLSYALRSGSGIFGATRLRASYGQGIKEPTILPPNCSPQLKAEQSVTVDAGIDQYFASGRLRFSATFFHNDFRDIVSFTFGGAAPNCPAFAGNFFNTDKARAAGVNSSFEVRAMRWLTLAGNYSYDDSKVLAAPNAFDPALSPGNRLLKRPLHSANLVANAHFLRMNWNLAGYYVGRRTDSDFFGLGLTSNPGYVRWDLSNSIDLGHGVSTVAHFENLFDRHYQDAIGYPALGYNYRLGLKYVWGGRN